MSVTVTRTLLGLPDLELNDFVRYSIGAQFLGGNVSWNKQQVGSIFVDGQTTTARSMQNVTEQVAVEVYAEDIDELRANTTEVDQAFFQDSFVMTVTVDGVVYAQYMCEAADRQLTWTGPRLIEHQNAIVYSMPRQPLPLAGVA